MPIFLGLHIALSIRPNALRAAWRAPGLRQLIGTRVSAPARTALVHDRQRPFGTHLLAAGWLGGQSRRTFPQKPTSRLQRPWIHEIKHDGFRIVACKNGEQD